jgi:hypothetical protein
MNLLFASGREKVKVFFNKISEYNKYVLLVAFSIFSLFSLISLLEEKYSDIIWYLLNLEKFLIISFAILVSWVMLTNIFNKKEKLTTLYYLLALSLSQYIIQLTKKTKFYTLENENILYKIYENTFSSEYEYTFVFMFFVIMILMLILVISVRIAERNLETPEKLKLDDVKKLLSIIVFSIIVSLIIDVQNAVLENSKKQISSKDIRN